MTISGSKSFKKGQKKAEMECFLIFSHYVLGQQAILSGNFSLEILGFGRSVT